jgi:membrane-associated phospholipid phosphatase
MALWSGVALIALVVLTGLLIPARPLAIDHTWSGWMRDLGAGAPHRLALAFNYLGRGLGRALSLAGIGVVLAVVGRWRALVAFAAAESLTPIVSNLTKHLVDRPRPPHSLLHVTGSSFPSGHAAYAAATAVTLVLVLTRPGRRRIWWAVAALAVAGMAWSRTYLQVHWLMDALAGAVLGGGVALASVAAVQMLAERRWVSRSRRTS